MLQKQKQKQEAMKWLGYLRGDINEYNKDCLQFLREEIADGGLTLEDIGTSEKELEEFRIKIHRFSAKKYLEYLRDGTEQYKNYLQFLREEIAEGGLTLEDIGTSEEELSRLAKA